MISSLSISFVTEPLPLDKVRFRSASTSAPSMDFVGQFTANDPDDGNLTFNLEDGESPDHAFFRLESNGSLFTSTTFDFENNTFKNI